MNWIDGAEQTSVQKLTVALGSKQAGRVTVLARVELKLDEPSTCQRNVGS